MCFEVRVQRPTSGRVPQIFSKNFGNPGGIDSYLIEKTRYFNAAEQSAVL
jgi:hypothetical protein